MIVKTKTIKGWANNSDLMFSPNTNNLNFVKNLEKFKAENLQGFTQLLTGFKTLRGKEVKEKIIIKGWYWRGSWSSPTKETIAIFYK